MNICYRTWLQHTEMYLQSYREASWEQYLRNLQMNTLDMSADLVKVVAKMIAYCDFRVTVSCYVTRSNTPWVITVGESDWQRHLVVEGIGFEGSALDAQLAILARGESERFGYDIGHNNVAKQMSLGQLVSGGYSGVKNELRYGC